MGRIFLFLGSYILSVSVYSQSVNRVEVNGLILSNTNDVEAVTVFNKSSNKGTITNIGGAFKLYVALYDVIEISALQFQKITLTIDAPIIQSKQLKIQLVEQVNQLDAVSLSAGLTGNIETDIVNVKTVKPITIDKGNMNVDFEYHDDKAFDNSVISDHYTSITEPGARKYMPDFIKIVKFLTKSKKELKVKKEIFVGFKYDKPKDIFSVYTLNEIQEQFEIPEEKLQIFIAFVENNGIPPEWLEPENELLLIEFLMKQKKLFLKEQDAKN